MIRCFRARDETMTRLGLYGAGVLFLSVSISAVVEGAQGRLEEGVGHFRAAYRVWDVEKLGQAAQILEKACRETPDDHLAYHWLGVARFHILVHREGGVGRKPARR